MNRAQLAVYRLQLALPVVRHMARLYVRTFKRACLAAIVSGGRAMAVELSHGATSVRRELPARLGEDCCRDLQTEVKRVDAVVFWASQRLAACDS